MADIDNIKSLIARINVMAARFGGKMGLTSDGRLYQTIIRPEGPRTTLYTDTGDDLDFVERVLELVLENREHDYDVAKPWCDATAWSRLPADSPLRAVRIDQTCLT